jgi:HlyD family secretion protein
MNKKGLLIAVLASVFLILLIVPVKFGFFRSREVQPDKMVTAIVDRGQVFIPIEASGVVEPENEAIILSPATSIIQKINKEPGSRVSKGEVIIELDDSPTLSEITQIKDQLEVKSNALERSRLDAQMTRIDLGYNVEVKKLKIASIKAQLADEEQLLSVGGISSAKIDETRQSLVLAQKDLDMVQEKNTIRLKQLKTEEIGLNLQIEIQKKQLAEKQELWGKLKIKAPSDGIILSISGKTGEKISGDKTLVTMSDLTSFKIRGSIDEKYSEYIKTGLPIYLLEGNEKLKGVIGNVTPTVSENNKITFNVHPEQSSNPNLIPNQTVRLLVLKSLKDNVLRVSASRNFRENSEQTIYVLDSGKVVERSVKFGIKGSEFQEVLSGLKVGDRVVLSESPSFWTRSN